MQPQGLEALMPQGQPMPQMDNPRLAAATDVVSSDAEEQILDPRTLAMLKYKDALQAMQAADQMMAAAQPAPTAPTVAERTKLAAEQGIAGLAQRLAPGVQQQGRQVAAQQAQQAQGGLPQLPAPNMAGMAGGGIVGYADGGAPTPTKAVPRPVPMGQPNVGAQAAVSDDVARYIYNYTNLRASMEAATDPQQKAEIAQLLREMQQTYNADVVSEAHMKMSQQSGMAGGGIVAFSGEDGSVVEKPPKATSLRREKELVDAGVPPDEARRIAREEMYQGMGELAVPTLLTALDTPRRVITEVVPGAVADAYRGAAGVFRRNIEDPARAMLEGATRGGGEPTTAEEIAALYPDSTTATPAAQETSPSTGTVNLSELDKLFPKREAPGAPAAKPMDGIAGILQAMQTQARAPVTAGVASESTNERQAQVDALTEQRMNPNYAETTRTAEEARYRAATDPSMEELKALIRSRSDALDKPMFTPEEERSRKISALLQGLASSNLIAQSGPAASRGIAAVSDAVREDSRARAEKQFDLASSLIGADMKASQDAFAAGLSATTQAMADQSVALNAVSSQLIAEGNREAAALIAQSQNQMKVFEAQLKDASELRKLLSDKSIADTQAGAAARRDLINLQGNLYSGVDAIDRTIAEMNDSLGAATPASQAAVTTLNNQKAAMIRGADAISQEFGINVNSAEGMGDGSGGTGAFSDASDEDILNLLGQ